MPEGPPPFVPPLPQKRGMSTGTIVLIVGLVVGLPCIALIGGMVWLLTKGVGIVVPVLECSQRFEDVREAIRLYAKEHDGTLPNAATWQDDVKGYLKDIPDRMNSEGRMKLRKLEPEGIWGCAAGDQKWTGMAFNSELSGKKITDVKNPEQTVLVFEIPEPKRNANLPYKAPPVEKSPMVLGEHRPWFRIPVEGKLPTTIEKKVSSQMPEGS